MTKETRLFNFSTSPGQFIPAAERRLTNLNFHSRLPGGGLTWTGMTRDDLKALREEINRCLEDNNDS